MGTLKSIVIVVVVLFSSVVKAQVSVSVNIGSPPQWGPVGYTEVRYYYLPDVEAYYDVHTSMFIYFGGGAWIHRAYLPEQYVSYDLYSGYKVVMTDYRGDAPYIDFDKYKIKYAKGYRGKAQKTIGEKPGKGNSKTKTVSKAPSEKKAGQGNDKSVHKSNDKGSPQENKTNTKGKQGHGNGKKK